MEETFTCDTFRESCVDIDEILSVNRYNEQWKDDATWILVSSFVIFTMQSGFGMLEIGACTAGNEVNVMLKNVADILFGAFAFYCVGYGIAYGRPSNPFMGLGDIFPEVDANAEPVESGILFAQYLFQLSFAATSATIVSGCIAMRLRFEVYCLFAFYAVIVYAFVAHWVWADDGWLNTLGFHDFAGGSAVHLHGAANGLIAILFVGSRRGRFDGSRPQSDFAESSPTSMLFGLFTLWWGWIGFNCGSSFGIANDKWIIAARAGINTLNASSAGGIVAMIYGAVRSGGKYVHPADVVNGVLAALVASSPTCATSHGYESLIIGAIASLLGNWMNNTVMKKWLRLDDPVGAMGVHLGGGLWGCFAVGLFADSTLPGSGIEKSGLFRGGGFELLGKQLIGIAAICGWSLVTMTPFFYVVGCIISRNWRNPRLGLRHEYLQVDPHIHNCTEDPTDMINAEIQKALKERDQANVNRTGGVLTGIVDKSRNYMNNLSLSTRDKRVDNDVAAKALAIVQEDHSDDDPTLKTEPLEQYLGEEAC